ncbi:MAG: hypothetical protein Q9193_001244 [Seirophora villosa]
MWGLDALGHAVSFFRDADKTFTKGRLYFGNTREPWGITIAGQQIYVVTSPSDVSAVYKNIEQLTFDDYIEDMMLRFGASKSSVETMLRKPDELDQPSSGLQPNPTKKSLLRLCESLYHQALLPGEKSETLQESFLGNIHKSLTWESMTSTVILSSDSTHHRTVSLLNWTREVLLDGATKAFFGNRLTELEPKLYEKFVYFDDNSWKFTYKVPRLWSSDIYAAKKTAQDAMEAYFNLPKEQRPGATWLIQSLEAEMRARSIGESDIAAILMMTFWVINGNAYKLCFWVLAHILYDPSLFASTRAEAISAVRSSASPNSLAANLDKCPHLNAVLNETLRITSSSSTIRNVVGSFTLGGKRLRKGTKVLIPARQLHLDDRAFGVDAKSFDAERFLEKKDLVRSSNFRPFGGGTTYCPGRFIAKREVLTFVALVLARFELSLPKSGTNGATTPIFPRIEDGKPCLGIMGPRLGWDTRVQVQKVE